MRDLDFINSAAKSTRFIFSISLIIPIFMGCGGWALAAGAAPWLPLEENYLEMFSIGIIALAILASPLPYIFRWNWETKYFGAGAICLYSGSILGIYPILCIAQYSLLPISVRLGIIFFEGAIILHWCSRFARIYRTIYQNKDLFKNVYCEELSAIYYLQQGDRKMAQNVFKFEQFPPSKYFVFCFLTAFALIPFSSSISELIGVPFIHIFLAVLATPINLIFFGLGTKAWLVFYFYPMKIKSKTHKVVYVDIASKPLDRLSK